MRKLKLVSTELSAVTYRFRGEAPFSWAACTVNDVTGELLITSDYGNWSHRWPVNGLGDKTLTAFIGQGDVDYLARKLDPSEQRGRAFSAVETIKALRRLVVKRRLENGRTRLEDRTTDPEDFGPDGKVLPYLRQNLTDDGFPRYEENADWFLSKSQARELWNALGRYEGYRGGDSFYHEVMGIPGFEEFVTSEPWEYQQSDREPPNSALREIVLPALIEACRDNTEKKDPLNA